MVVKINKTFFCKEPSETCKGQDIFNVLSSCLETNGLSWENCVGISTYGVPPVIGSIRSFAFLVKKEKILRLPQYPASFTEVLASKTLRNE